MSINSAILLVKISLTLQKRNLSKGVVSMKKYDCYLFFVSLVTAFLSFAAAMPGIPGVVTTIYCSRAF